MKKNKAEAAARLEEFEMVCSSLRADIAEMKRLSKILKTTRKKEQRLGDYLQTNWLDDVSWVKNQKTLRILSQDYAYDLLMEYAETRNKLIKILVKDL